MAVRTKRFMVTIEEELWKRLKIDAHIRGCTIRMLMYEIIKEYVVGRKKYLVKYLKQIEEDEER